MWDEDQLTSYPRPSVAVDVAVLTALPAAPAGAGVGTLAVLVTNGSATPGPALPGRFLRERQTVSECVSDVLRIKAGLTDVSAEPRLLSIFDDPSRDPRGWTLSLAHALVLPHRRLREATGEIVAISTQGRLAPGQSLLFDHEAIVSEAAAMVRESYERLPDPEGLLEHPFTLAQLRTVHQAVLGAQLRKDTFRRRMEANLRPLSGPDGAAVLRSDGGRPAQVYVRRSDLMPSPAAQRRLQLPRG
ncbi:MAG TPA: hypothetical protein VF635_18220 [Propionibacteriaceae bacterium]